MTTVFPGAIDDFTNPTGSTSQNASRTHAQQHSDLNDAIEAVERSLFGWVSIFTFGAKGDGVTDDTAAFVAAAASGKSVYAFGGTYILNSAAVITLTRQRIHGYMDATIVVNGSIGLDVTSAVNSEISGFRFTGASAADGKIALRLADHDACRWHDNEFKLIGTGIQSLAKVREVWYDGTNYVPSAIENNRLLNCGYGIRLMDKAEYISVNANYAFACTVAGIYSEAGNCPIVNNTITACEIGIWQKGNAVSGVLDNPDHNTIGFNTCNHCVSCGILLDGVSISTSMVGNQVWASKAAGALFSYGKGYGVFYRNSRRIISRGNVMMNSTYNVGFDGLADSTLDDLIEHTDLDITFYYYCEGNGAFGDNRNVTIKLGSTDSAAVQNVIANYTAGINRLFRITPNALVQAVALDNAVVVDYKHDGRHDEVIAFGTYVNKLVVPDYRKGTTLTVNVQSAITSPGILMEFPTSAVLTSGTPWAVVSGNTVRLRGQQGRFTFTATPAQNSWLITFEGVGAGALIYGAGTGTAYTLTTTTAAVDFSTTDPAIVLPGPGTYLITAQFQIEAQAATVGTTQNLDLRIRRTNNTPADIDQAIIDMQPLTAQTVTQGRYTLQARYTTFNSDDAVALFAGLSAALGAGTMTVSKATIVAELDH